MEPQTFKLKAIKTRAVNSKPYTFILTKRNWVAGEENVEPQTFKPKVIKTRASSPKPYTPKLEVRI